MNEKSSWQTVSVKDGTEMRLYVARPDTAEKAPAILVLQEAFGVNSHIQRVTEKVAKLGYLAVAPELFHRSAEPGFIGSYTDFPAIMPHLQAVTEEGLANDLLAAYDWIKNDSLASSERLGSVGFCMGGRASFLANSVLPLKAAVSYYGGNIAPNLLSHAKNQHAPILFFWGGKDTHIPKEQRDAVTAALDAANKAYLNVEVSYAGHGFNCDERESYNLSASRYAWALTLEFFRDLL